VRACAAGAVSFPVDLTASLETTLRQPNEIRALVNMMGRTKCGEALLFLTDSAAQTDLKLATLRYLKDSHKLNLPSRVRADVRCDLISSSCQVSFPTLSKVRQACFVTVRNSETFNFYLRCHPQSAVPLIQDTMPLTREMRRVIDMVRDRAAVQAALQRLGASPSEENNAMANRLHFLCMLQELEQTSDECDREHLVS
jgi:hypothetical protein